MQVIQGACWHSAHWVPLFMAKLIKSTIYILSTRQQLVKCLNKQAFTMYVRQLCRDLNLKGQGTAKPLSVDTSRKLLNLWLKQFFFLCFLISWFYVLASFITKKNSSTLQKKTIMPHDYAVLTSCKLLLLRVRQKIFLAFLAIQCCNYSTFPLQSKRANAATDNM